MFFEGAVHDTQNAKSPEEFQQGLRKHLNPGKISEKRLVECLEEMFPYGGVIEKDKAERKRRAAVSRKMQDAMIRWLADHNKTNIEREKTPRVQLERSLAYDTLLLLPHPEQTEEYEYRYKVLTQGTPGQKGWLVMQGLHEAKQGYTPEKLMNLTDEQIAADFEGLLRLEGYANSAVALSQNTSLKLTDDQRKELRDFEKEFAALATRVYNRAKMIASPYYELVHPERLQDLDNGGMKADPEEVGQTEDERKALGQMEKDVGSYQSFCMRIPWHDEIRDRGLEGFQSEEVTWLDQDGVEIQKRLTAPPVKQLINGKPLTAILPNGKVKVFAPAYLGESNIALNTSPLSVYLEKQDPGMPKRVSTNLDKKIPGALDSLSRGLKKVDHWYIRGSQEFKNVQADLEKMQEKWRALGPNPTQYQRDRLREQMQELDAHCAEYISNKKRKEKLNDRDKERLAAIKAVSQFARTQIVSLRLLENCAEIKEKARSAKENPAERAAFQEAQSQARREARKEGKLPEEEVKKFEERTKANAEAGLERLAETQLLNLPKTMVGQYEKYRNMTLPKSDAGNGASELSQRITKQIGNLSHKQVSEQEVKSSGPMLMRDILTLDAVLNERAENKFKREGDPAGVYEGLTNDPDCLKWLQNAIVKTPAFKKMTDKLTPDSLNDFIMKRNVKETLDEVFHDIQKSAAKVNDQRREEVERAERLAKAEAEREAAELKQYGEIKTIGSVTELGDQIAAYKRLQCPASKWGDELDSMRRQVISTLNEQSWRQDVHESFIRRNMAKMVAINLILRERTIPEEQREKLDGPYESLEDALNKVGSIEFAQSIVELPEFQKHTENLDAQSYKKFFAENQVWKIGQNLIEQFHPQNQKGGQSKSQGQAVIEHNNAPKQKNNVPKVK